MPITVQFCVGSIHHRKYKRGKVTNFNYGKLQNSVCKINWVKEKFVQNVSWAVSSPASCSQNAESPCPCLSGTRRACRLESKTNRKTWMSAAAVWFHHPTNGQLRILHRISTQSLSKISYAYIGRQQLQKQQTKGGGRFASSLPSLKQQAVILTLLFQ